MYAAELTGELRSEPADHRTGCSRLAALTAQQRHWRHSHCHRRAGDFYSTTVPPVRTPGLCPSALNSSELRPPLGQRLMHRGDGAGPGPEEQRPPCSPARPTRRSHAGSSSGSPGRARRRRVLSGRPAMGACLFTLLPCESAGRGSERRPSAGDPDRWVEPQQDAQHPVPLRWSPFATPHALQTLGSSLSFHH